MKGLDETQLVDFLEAAYAIDRDDEEWLTAALHALDGVCSNAYKYLGLFYDASDVEHLEIWNLCAPPGSSVNLPRLLRTFWSTVTPDFVRATFRGLHFGSARMNASAHFAPLLAERDRSGHGDFFILNGLDTSGLGCVAILGCEERELCPEERETAILKRLATHLGVAHRCRRKVRASSSSVEKANLTNGAEAILDANGRFVHAEGAAKGSRARDAIRAASATIDATRSKGHRQAGARALNVWSPLAAARWTLVDSFEENGRRYVVARENQATASDIDILTERERQVVTHAMLGLTNKEVAYALGISDNTVRVLMARAAKRLGASGRNELLDHPTLRRLPATAQSKN